MKKSLFCNQKTVPNAGISLLLLLLGIVITVSVGITGCEKGDLLEVNIPGWTPGTPAQFGSTGGSKTLDIKTNSPWTITVSLDAAEWLKVSQTSGDKSMQVALMVEPNPEVTKRIGTISISTESSKKIEQFTIEVEGAAPKFMVPAESDGISFGTSGEEKSFTISSNLPWTLKVNEKGSDNVPSWVQLSQTSGSKDATIKVTCETNKTITERLAVISIICNHELKTETKTIEIKQIAAAPVFTVSTSSMNVAAQGEALSFTITSNVAWTVSSNASWAKVSQASGSNDATVNITVDPNTSTSARTATISVKGNNETKTISISQAGAASNLTVSPSSLSFDHKAGSKSFSVTSNTSWTVSRGSASWLTVSPASGTGSRSVSVSASANTSTSSRSATITVTGGGATRNITVTQAGTPTSSVTFWTGFSGFGTITVTLQGYGTKTITKVLSSMPNCGADGCANWTNIPPGTYTVSATCSNPGYTMYDGTFTIDCDYACYPFEYILMTSAPRSGQSAPSSFMFMGAPVNKE